VAEEEGPVSLELQRKLAVEFVGMFIFVFTVGMGTNKLGDRCRRSPSGRSSW
jgi:hypothetical protein